MTRLNDALINTSCETIRKITSLVIKPYEE